MWLIDLFLLVCFYCFLSTSLKQRCREGLICNWTRRHCLLAWDISQILSSGSSTSLHPIRVIEYGLHIMFLAEQDKLASEDSWSAIQVYSVIQRLNYPLSSLTWKTWDACVILIWFSFFTEILPQSRLTSLKKRDLPSLGNHLLLFHKLCFIYSQQTLT